MITDLCARSSSKIRSVGTDRNPTDMSLEIGTLLATDRKKNCMKLHSVLSLERTEGYSPVATVTFSTETYDRKLLAVFLSRPGRLSGSRKGKSSDKL